MLVVKSLQEVPSRGHDFEMLEGVKVEKELLLRIDIWIVERMVVG